MSGKISAQDRQNAIACSKQIEGTHEDITQLRVVYLVHQPRDRIDSALDRPFVVAHQFFSFCRDRLQPRQRQIRHCSLPSRHRMLAVRTPGAPQTARNDAAAIPPSPLRDRVGYSDDDRFRGHFPVHCRCGLQPPCLRFAAAVTVCHARLGTRLVAGLCRGRHLRRLSSRACKAQPAQIVAPRRRLLSSKILSKSARLT
jgi:hypothetical protein